ncbi:MAG: hypothetical protein H7178_04670 [Chitinophagaceae bacterium]|nr:hypothetical protein [Chitinophagaceae bacterium]
MQARKPEVKANGKPVKKDTSKKPQKGSFQAIMEAAAVARKKGLENYAR